MYAVRSARDLEARHELDQSAGVTRVTGFGQLDRKSQPLTIGVHQQSVWPGRSVPGVEQVVTVVEHERRVARAHGCSRGGWQAEAADERRATGRQRKLAAARTGFF